MCKISDLRNASSKFSLWKITNSFTNETMDNLLKPKGSISTLYVSST